MVCITANSILHKRKERTNDMCVGLSARVMRVDRGTMLVDASGAKREVSAELLDDVEPGDFVMVHAGVAIAKITDNDAEETDALAQQLLG